MFKKQHEYKVRTFYSTSQVKEVIPVSYPCFCLLSLAFSNYKTQQSPHPHSQQLSYPSRLHTHHSDSFENLLTMTFGKYKPISIQLNKHTMLTFSKRSERSFL